MTGRLGKDVTYMKTAQREENRTSTYTEEYRLQLIDEIQTALHCLSREQKKTLLERLKALAGEDAEEKAVG